MEKVNFLIVFLKKTQVHPKKANFPDKNSFIYLILI